MVIKGDAERGCFQNATFQITICTSRGRDSSRAPGYPRAHDEQVVKIIESDPYYEDTVDSCILIFLASSGDIRRSGEPLPSRRRAMLLEGLVTCCFSLGADTPFTMGS